MNLCNESLARHALLLGIVLGTLAAPASVIGAQASPAATPVGSQPPAEALPRVEFAFEARVTVAPAVVLGDTGLGHRQYIPITGGVVSGPRFKGTVVPAGWDYQWRSSAGCSTLTADYFWRADDGTLVHILNEGLMCPGGSDAEGRTWLRPRFEAPKGSHEWLTRATFVASLETELTPPPQGGAPVLSAVRIRFYQVR